MNGVTHSATETMNGVTHSATESRHKSGLEILFSTDSVNS